ncbi:hypothetical protein [Methanocella conradii]|uniref:hypothetical protein n=1 Tax=Methanocella conradii TaxID=1175444 RepID=UPI0024B38A63|nr:hypothetical protein [Methanocella conradii]MDI6897079.1 hypothetical protein [Methanocella conradii]
MNLMKTAKIIIIASPIVAAVSFLALANQLVVKDSMVNSIGMFITLLSVLMFIISLVVIAIKKAQESKIRKSTSKQEAKEIVQTIKTQTRIAKDATNAPRWYRLSKLIIGLIIIFGLYIAVPLWVGFVFLNRPGTGVENGPAIMNVFFGYFATFMQYLLPLPVGPFVWIATLIGLFFIIFHKKYWKIPDAMAIIILLALMMLFVLISSGQ